MEQHPDLTPGVCYEENGVLRQEERRGMLATMVPTLVVGLHGGKYGERAVWGEDAWQEV
jgi:hypothetical protein